MLRTLHILVKITKYLNLLKTNIQVTKFQYRRSNFYYNSNCILEGVLKFCLHQGRSQPQFSQNLDLGLSEGQWRNDATSHFRHISSHSRFDVTLPGFEKVFVSASKNVTIFQFLSVLPKMWRFPKCDDFPVWCSILACNRDTVTRSNGFKIIRSRDRSINTCLASTGGALHVYSQEQRRSCGQHNGMQHRICLWVYMRVQHNRMQHRVFVCVHMNIHVTQHECLRSVASHRRSHQDPAEVHQLSLCSWYVQHSQEFHTRVQYMCNSKVVINKSWLHWPAALYPAPWQPPYAPSCGGAQGLGTAPEYTWCKNVTNVACVSQHYCPVAYIAERETSRPHRLCSWRLRSPSAHFWVTNGFFEGRIFAILGVTN